MGYFVLLCAHLSDCAPLQRDKGPEDKVKQKRKMKEKKPTTKLKTREGEDDDDTGWTEVKGSSMSAVVCVLMFKQVLLTGTIRNVWRAVGRICMLILGFNRDFNKF